MTTSEQRRLEAFARDLARVCMAHGIPLDAENPETGGLITVTLADGRAVARVWTGDSLAGDPPAAEAVAGPVPF